MDDIFLDVVNLSLTASWVIMVVLLLRLLLRQQLREAVPAGEGVYLCAAVPSPFVFGIFNPKIYLPFDLSEEQQRWILLHERSHIARRDFLLKPLFWLAVLLHWMNPLVWIAWRFYSRDVELACDERAIRQLDDCQKRRYGNTLLQLAVQTPKWSCPAAFGNNSVKQRIRHVLRYKQAALGVTAMAVIVIVMMMAALGVNPVQVYPLGDLQPELEEKVDTAYLQWGSVQLEITEQEDIDRLIYKCRKKRQSQTVPFPRMSRCTLQSLLRKQRIPIGFVSQPLRAIAQRRYSPPGKVPDIFR